jgi:ribosomal protein L32E
MLLLRHGTHPGSGKETSVNAIAIIYVNQHLDSIRAEHQRNRMASGVAKRSLRSRIAAAAASLGIVSANSDPVVPSLTNYPYGG